MSSGNRNRPAYIPNNTPWSAYFFSKRTVPLDTWTYLRKLARKQLSPSAQLKLEWIIFYHTQAKKNATFTAKHFGISRKTLHKWLHRFARQHLPTLEEQSRTPTHVKQWSITRLEEARIVKLRQDNMEFGKAKLKLLYQKLYNEKISAWKIERVIRHKKLFPDKRTHALSIARRKGGEEKARIHQMKKQIEQTKQFGFLWHIDTIVVYWNGTKRYIFTALEEQSRIAYARVYTQNTSKYAEDFLKRLMFLVEGKVTILHSDNGSEFQGAFEKACAQLHITQVYSRPRTPKDNAKLEKFNGTLQNEWLAFSFVGLDTIFDANKDLTEWLVKYNSVRPHAALQYLTPLEFAQKHYFQVLPMWSARTRGCNFHNRLL